MALKILAVTSEAYPLAKTGGLGDAISGMARAYDKQGGDLTLLLPAYRGVIDQVQNAREVAPLRGLPGGEATLISAYCDALGLPVLLLKNDALFDRDNLYVDENGQEYEDNPVRFAALAHAATRIAAGHTPLPAPHVVHANDWHAALIPLFMHQAGVKKVKSVLTVHNLAFQGVYDMSLAPKLGIAPEYLTPDGIEFWGKLNFMKAGILFADRITAVSHTYAREILTPKFGCGLEGVLQSRADSLVAVPNGIDVDVWDPDRAEQIPHRRFNANDLTNKATCKRELQEAFGLTVDPSTTLMVMGSRLTTQKMADLAAEAIPRALDKHPNLQVALIGQGDKRLEHALKSATERFPNRFSVRIGFNEKTAHLLHAGGDILLHGSRFEPFGLTPIYAMRYGTLPIGSKTGGMADTISDPGVGSSADAAQHASGFLFEGETVDAMSGAIDRAVALHAEQPELWRKMQYNGMTADFSWDRCAPVYAQLFKSIVPVELMVAPAPAVVSLAKPSPVRAVGAAASALPKTAMAKAVATAGKAVAARRKARSDDTRQERLLPGAAAA